MKAVASILFLLLFQFTIAQSPPKTNLALSVGDYRPDGFPAIPGTDTVYFYKSFQDTPSLTIVSQPYRRVPIDRQILRYA